MKAIRYSILLVAVIFISAFKTDVQACTTPTNLHTASITSGRVVAVWDAVPNAVLYRVAIQEVGVPGWTNADVTDTLNTFTGLNPCADYKIRVRAKCSSWSGWTSIIDTKTSCSVLPKELKLISKSLSTGSEIIVRWAPVNFETWRWGNENGYTLERITLRANGSNLDFQTRANSKVVLASDLIPIPEHEWEPMADTSDFAGVAAGSIFGDSLKVVNLDSVNMVTAYNQYQQDDNRFGMSLFAADQDFEVAKAMGLGYKDVNVVAGEEYLYSIILNNLPSNAVTDEQGLLQATDDITQFPAPSLLKAMPGDSSVIISWNKGAINSFYNSYIVEKSEDNGSTWQQVNSLPLVGTDGDPDLALFSDTLANNTDTYVYRVKGSSPFGYMSPPSDTIHVKGVPARTPASPFISDAVENSSGEMNITWTFPTEYVSAIQGFDIYRSENSKKNFQKINSSLLANTAVSYLDNNPIPVAYYVVKAIDNNNYELESFPKLAQTTDTIPPSIPTGLACSCDASGTVTISWQHGAEPDLRGFRVFTSNLEFGNYVVVTPNIVNEDNYSHSVNINTLSDQLFYKVKSFDNRENQSDFSVVCAASLPDVTPPSKPNITNIQPSRTDVFFGWAPSSSSDVEYHVFQRRIKTSNDWQDIFTFPYASELEYSDTSASSREIYEYRLLAYDEADNFSSSIIVEASPFDDGFRDSIQNFNGFFIGNTGLNDQNRYVQLSWTYRKEPQLAGFQIFRAVNNGVMSPFKYLDKADAASQSNGFGTHGHMDFDINVQRGRPSTLLVNLPSNIPPQVAVFVSNGPRGSNIPLPVPVPRNSNLFLYQVMAEFTDGSFSPLTDIVAVFVPIR